MTIQTLNREYYMIQRLMHSDEMDIYLCKDNKSEDTTVSYRLIRLKNETMIRDAISIFMDQKDNKANQNFVECFPKDGEFYVVFIHSGEDSIEKKLATEKCRLVERLEIGKNIIEKMILLNIPYFMQHEALVMENLTVSPSLTIGFNYTLEELNKKDVIALEDVVKAYGTVCELLFEEELKIEACEELKQFIVKLEAGEFENYFLIYQAFNQVYTKLKELDQNGQVKPRGFWFRMWDKTKKIAHKIKPFVFTLVLLIIVGYFIYTLMRSNQTTESQTVFKSIGTVEINDTEGGSVNK